MSKVGDAVSPDGADNIGLSTVANTATAPATKRGEHRQDERTAFEVRVCRRRWATAKHAPTGLLQYAMVMTVSQLSQRVGATARAGS
jgi:hypothetical protein